MTPEQLAASGSEDGHQAALFRWAQQNLRDFPNLDLMFAIPNGGARDPRTGARLKMTGVKKGVPDVFLPVPLGRFAGLFIEMKKPADREKKRRAGTTSSEQDEYIRRLGALQYYVGVCYSWEEAVSFIHWYYGKIQ